MSTVDPLVAALIALCEQEGDYKAVADKAKVSADNLWQIVNGTKLPSGSPRGVGPSLRRKIAAAYPDWLDAGNRVPSPAKPQPIPAADLSPEAVSIGQLFDRLTDMIDRAKAQTAATAAILEVLDARSQGYVKQTRVEPFHPAQQKAPALKKGGNP